MNFLQLALFLFFWSFSTISSAEGIPGANDPALKKAALEWLSAEDPTQSITALGVLASGGNIAAQLLVNRIDSIFGRLDFPNLTRAERKELLFPENGRSTSRFSPYRVESFPLKPMVIREMMANAKTPENWMSGAEILINAGLMSQLKVELQFVLMNRPALDIEAVLFAEKYVRDEDEVKRDLWYFRAFEQIGLGFFEKYEPKRFMDRRERWKQDPWSSEQNARFSQALAAGNWSAIVARATLRSLAEEASFSMGDISDDAIMRMVDLVYSSNPAKQAEAFEASDEDMIALGRLIELNAAKSPYLRPLLNSCKASCPDDVTSCLAGGALARLDRDFYGAWAIDPVFSSDEYDSSRRAAREMTLMFGTMMKSRLEPARMRFMPQCYRRAAERLADIAYPPKD